ncbi:GGDEF domain-containing protein [Hydrogenimonas cancrithermarum]|uniref:diguanylate cyclase n=1 Tax=Hydrogenimonas cancrithermarum TaxID=2993563 RepID=A0ABN6WWH9_9BACT|nr:GGDEF domain-containing protein [Hydrogenimonas cancrithermarum]BDY13489.1 hypothetical protein HCR_18010 [Hydrogenimonas cancrithermarum]
MLKPDKAKWKIALFASVMAVAASAGLVGVQWLLQDEPSDLSISVMGTLYLLLFSILFFKLLRQSAQLEQVEREKEAQKLLDDTTLLYKNRVFKELAGTQIRMCKRNNWPAGLILMDIDRLAKINEKYGYDAGNQVLKHFATVLKETVRDSDLVARFDDDRFALLLPDCDAKNAKKVIQRIQARILEAPPKIEKSTIKIPFSSGVVSFNGKVAKLNHMLKRAGEALEAAKRRGGNRIELF